MIFGKQLCQSYQKLAQLSRTYFVFFRNPSTAEKFNFQWHASFGFIELFFGNINFLVLCLTPLPKWSCRTFFLGLEKNQTFSHFFMLWRGKNQSDFFIKQNKIQLGPPWKMMTNQNFHCLRNPYFFAWETILQNQSLHSQ